MKTETERVGIILYASRVAVGIGLGSPLESPRFRSDPTESRARAPSSFG